MQDAWRAYLEMALGLTEAPRKKAQKVAGDLVNRGGATAAQLQGLVEDLMSTGMANREALTNIVRFEVDRALGVVGLASAEEVSDLTSRVKDLERQLREERARASAAEAAVQGTGGGLVPSTATGAGTGGDRLDKPAPIKKAVAKKAVKATPNAMPKAATTVTPPAKKVAPAPPAAPVKAAKKTAVTPTPPPAKSSKAAKAAKKTAVAPTPPAKAAKKTAAAPVPSAEPAPAKAAKKAAKSTPAPAGTAEAPTAAVKAAAAATELPPAKKTAAKKAAKKVAPPAFIDPTRPEA